MMNLYLYWNSETYDEDISKWMNADEKQKFTNDIADWVENCR